MHLELINTHLNINIKKTQTRKKKQSNEKDKTENMLKWENLKVSL